MSESFGGAGVREPASIVGAHLSFEGSLNDSCKAHRLGDERIRNRESVQVHQIALASLVSQKQNCQRSFLQAESPPVDSPSLDIPLPFAISAKEQKPLAVHRSLLTLKPSELDQADGRGPAPKQSFSVSKKSLEPQPSQVHFADDSRLAQFYERDEGPP